MWNRPKLGVLVEVEEEVRTEQQSTRGPQRERRTIKLFRLDHQIYHNRRNRWLCNFSRSLRKLNNLKYIGEVRTEPQSACGSQVKSTKIKIELQPTRATYSRNFQCRQGSTNGSILPSRMVGSFYLKEWIGGSQALVVVSRHLGIPSLPKPDYITLEIYCRYQNSFT